MLRTFSEHKVRGVESLDGRWQFEADAAKSKGIHTLQVPGAWETVPGLETYRGEACYRRSIFCPAATHLRLVFGGVSHTADVFLDGEPVAHHYDAFTPFAAVVPQVSAGAHELAVRVDNRFGENSCLHIENDYYTYGGITRPVEIQRLPDVFIEWVKAVPVKKWNGWGLDITVKLRNLSAEPRTRGISLSIAGTSYTAEQVQIGPEGRIEAEISLESLNVKAWSADHPELHYLKAELLENGLAVDDLIDRIGFREVKVEGKRILLNGQPLRLKGYNRHEDHPQFGCALNLQAMACDLEIIRDLGGNFVRTCHYPNDMRFLDLCDEMGFYVWEESHARTVDLSHPKFHEQIVNSTREMIRWHFNRPCVIMWGCLNECSSDTEGGAGEYRMVIDLIRSLDASRPVTFASNRGKKDLCFGLVDIVAVNIYTGWYQGGPQDIKPVLEDFVKWLHSSESRGGSGKPLIMSEFGAGAIYGNRQTNRSHWSEEYQCDVLDEALRVYLNHPDVSGAAIWQFCDVRVTPGWWKGRPKTMNNKGTVDAYRRPKLCYETVKRRMK